MTDIAIRVENLSKRYRIGGTQGHFQYGSLRDSLASAINAPLRRLRGSPNNQEDGTIWALKDVSFEVKKGEVLGIIGRNGAGKSTLLKILSRITRPTEGKVQLWGRVGSLLEVGTGFHPELTGGENIYLNGAVLGMRRLEIERKYDEIVDFAEIEQFLDTPVKFYSSGMYMRLAFAVAAHLEPEILLVDEVLAVGDAAFQKKSLGKMGEVANEGRTVLLVSHNLTSITRICDYAILFDLGHLIQYGDVNRIVSKYLLSGNRQEGLRTWKNGLADPGIEEFKIMSLRIRSERGEISTSLDVKLPFWIDVEFQVFKDLPTCRIGISLLTLDGIVVFVSYNTDDDENAGNIEPGNYTCSCLVPGNFLNPTRYSITIHAETSPKYRLARSEHVLSFEIENTGAIGSEFNPLRYGIIRPKLSWTQKKLE